MNTSKSPKNQLSIPAIEAEAIIPAAFLDKLIALLMNPETRKQVADRLETRIEARAKELAPLLAARKVLDSSSVRLETNPPTIEIHKKKDCTHVLAIAIALEDEKNGLTFSGLRSKLDEIGHPIEYKTLHNTVSRMVKRGQIKRKGTSGRFKYKIII